MNANLAKKSILISTIFWLHLVIVLIWFGLFLVPASWWPERVPFHFWFIISITIIQTLWGWFLYQRKFMPKFDIICPLTSLMQWLRGYPLNHPDNYGHYYITELLILWGIKNKTTKQVNKLVNYALWLSIVLIIWQYWQYRH